MVDMFTASALDPLLLTVHHLIKCKRQQTPHWLSVLHANLHAPSNGGDSAKVHKPHPVGCSIGREGKKE
jgi:hypothetical protein